MLFVLFFSLAAGLKSPSHDLAFRLAARLEARYRAAHTLQTRFLERYRENGRLVRSESGSAYFRKPGRMRWEYESPEKNLFLVDGKMAWFYVPSDHTVTRVPAKQSSDWRTPLALLAGGMKLDKVCASVELAAGVKPENVEDAVLYCIPRGSSPKKRESAQGAVSDQPLPEENAIFLEVAQSTAELVRVIVRDRGNVELEFKFANWQFDSPLSDALFSFKVPPGVAIVNGELPDENKGLN